MQGRKSNSMKRMEVAYKKPIEDILLDTLHDNDGNLSETAEVLGCSKATLGYWLLKCGIEIKRVPVKRGEKVVVVKEDELTGLVGDSTTLLPTYSPTDGTSKEIPHSNA